MAIAHGSAPAHPHQARSQPRLPAAPDEPSGTSRLAASPIGIALAGMASLASGMGIGRFVYTPILPAMTEGLGFGAASAGLIASVNFVGYLAGALLAAAWLPGSRRAWFLAALALGAVTTVAMVLVPVVAPTSFDQTYASYLRVAALGLTILLPVVAILMLTGEWSQRSVMTTFTQEPRRARVLNAKVATSVLLSGGAAVFGRWRRREHRRRRTGRIHRPDHRPRRRAGLGGPPGAQPAGPRRPG